MLVRTQHDALDLRRHARHRSRGATGAAGHGLAVQRIRRLRRLGHHIGARRQVGERVAALRVGLDLCRHRGARAVGAAQAHGDARDACFARIHHAVVVAIQPHAARDRAVLRDLTEIVVGGMLVGSHVNVADGRRRGRHRRRCTAGSAGHGLAIAGARRLLRLGHGVGARRQVGERIATLRVGVGRARDRVVRNVGAAQFHLDVGNARLAAVGEAIVVHVHPHLAGHRAVGRDFGEQVVARTAARRGQLDRGDRRWRGGDRRGVATRAAGGGDAVDGACRLGRFGQGVGTRAQALETETAVGVGGEGKADRAEIVGAGQDDVHAANAGITRIVLDAVVVGIEEHDARHRHRQDLTEIVGDGVLAAAQHDAGHRRRRDPRAGGSTGGDTRNRAGHGAAIEGGDGRSAHGDHRLRGLLGHHVGAGQQVVETIVAVAVGLHRSHRVAQRVHGAGRQTDGDAGNAGFARVDHAIVVGVQPYAAGNGAGQLAEVVAGGGTGQRQLAGDLHVGRGAGGSVFLAVGQAGGLGFDDPVIPADDGPIPRIGTVGGGFLGVARSPDVRRGFFENLDGNAGDGRVIGGDIVAVVVAVQIDQAADGGRQHLAEVELGAIARRQRDANDAVGGGGVAGLAGLRDTGGSAARHAIDLARVHRCRLVDVGAARRSGRQCFTQRIGLARAQVGELVGAAGAGGGRDRRATIEHRNVGRAVQHQQLHGRAADVQVGARVAHLVVVHVHIDVAGQGPANEFGEIELHAVGIVGQDDAADDAGGGGVAGHALVGHPRAAVLANGAQGIGLRHTVAGVLRRHLGLILGNGVAGAAGWRQTNEPVVATGIAGRGQTDQVAVEVGAGQGQGDAGNAGIGRIHIAVVVLVVEHAATDAGRRLHHDRRTALVVARNVVFGNLVALSVDARTDLDHIGAVDIEQRRCRTVVDSRPWPGPQGQRHHAVELREHAEQVAGDLLLVVARRHGGHAIGDVADVAGARCRHAGRHCQRGRQAGVCAAGYCRGRMRAGGQPFKAGRQRIDQADAVGRVDALVVHHDLVLHRLAHVHRVVADGGLGHAQVSDRHQQVLHAFQVVAGLGRVVRAFARGFVGARLVAADMGPVAEPNRAHAGRRAVVGHVDVDDETRRLAGLQYAGGIAETAADVLVGAAGLGADRRLAGHLGKASHRECEVRRQRHQLVDHLHAFGAGRAVVGHGEPVARRLSELEGRSQRNHVARRIHLHLVLLKVDARHFHVELDAAFVIALGIVIAAASGLLAAVIGAVFAQAAAQRHLGLVDDVGIERRSLRMIRRVQNRLLEPHADVDRFGNAAADNATAVDATHQGGVAAGGFGTDHIGRHRIHAHDFVGMLAQGSRAGEQGVLDDEGAHRYLERPEIAGLQLERERLADGRLDHVHALDQIHVQARLQVNRGAVGEIFGQHRVGRGQRDGVGQPVGAIALGHALVERARDVQYDFDRLARRDVLERAQLPAIAAGGNIRRAVVAGSARRHLAQCSAGKAAIDRDRNLRRGIAVAVAQDARQRVGQHQGLDGLLGRVARRTDQDAPIQVGGVRGQGRRGVHVVEPFAGNGAVAGDRGLLDQGDVRRVRIGAGQRGPQAAACRFAGVVRGFACVADRLRACRLRHAQGVQRRLAGAGRVAQPHRRGIGGHAGDAGTELHRRARALGQRHLVGIGGFAENAGGAIGTDAGRRRRVPRYRALPVSADRRHAIVAIRGIDFQRVQVVHHAQRMGRRGIGQRAAAGAAVGDGNRVGDDRTRRGGAGTGALALGQRQVGERRQHAVGDGRGVVGRVNIVKPGRRGDQHREVATRRRRWQPQFDREIARTVHRDRIGDRAGDDPAAVGGATHGDLQTAVRRGAIGRQVEGRGETESRWNHRLHRAARRRHRAIVPVGDRQCLVVGVAHRMRAAREAAQGLDVRTGGDDVVDLVGVVGDIAVQVGV